MTEEKPTLIAQLAAPVLKKQRCYASLPAWTRAADTHWLMPSFAGPLIVICLWTSRRTLESSSGISVRVQVGRELTRQPSTTALIKDNWRLSKALNIHKRNLCDRRASVMHLAVDGRLANRWPYLVDQRQARPSSSHTSKLPVCVSSWRPVTV